MRIVILALSACLLFSCGDKAGKTETANMDKQFDAYKERFVEDLWKVYPGWASSVGYHTYDSVLQVPDEVKRKEEIDFCMAHLDSLKKYKPEALSDNNQTDLVMIKGQLESSIWSIKELRSFEWDPSQYNVSGSFAEILNGTYDSLDKRLHNFYLKMEYIPAYYEAARKNIKNPTEEHRQLAIEQNIGGASVFENDLPEILAKSQLAETEKKKILARADTAVEAIKGYAQWLRELKVETPRTFRLGKELYAKKFAYDIQSGYTATEIYNKAIAHKRELHAKMSVLADRLWPKYMENAPRPADTLQLIRQVIDKISLKHTTPDSFQATIE